MSSIYNFPDQTRELTSNLRTITFPFDISLCEMVIQFKLKKGFNVPENASLGYEWKTSDNSISIISSTEINLNPKIVSATIGDYGYDLLIKFPSGVTKKYMEGSQKVISKISTI
mgnify:CR=1 FL=1